MTDLPRESARSVLAQLLLVTAVLVCSGVAVMLVLIAFAVQPDAHRYAYMPMLMDQRPMAEATLRFLHARLTADTQVITVIVLLLASASWRLASAAKAACLRHNSRPLPPALPAVPARKRLLAWCIHLCLASAAVPLLYSTWVLGLEIIVLLLSPDRYPAAERADSALQVLYWTLSASGKLPITVACVVVLVAVATAYWLTNRLLHPSSVRPDLR